MTLGVMSRPSMSGKRVLFPFLATLGFLVLAACASGEQGGSLSDKAPRSKPSAEALETFRELQNDPRFRSIIAALCEESLPQSGDFKTRTFVSSFLNVSTSESEAAFCGALFELIASGELTDEDIDRISEAEETHDYALIGGVLRKLLIAHERLNTQQVSRPSLLANHAESPKEWQAIHQ